jgi:hypothetical protein
MFWSYEAIFTEFTVYIHCCQSLTSTSEDRVSLLILVSSWAVIQLILWEILVQKYVCYTIFIHKHVQGMDYFSFTVCVL